MLVPSRDPSLRYAEVLMLSVGDAGMTYAIRRGAPSGAASRGLVGLVGDGLQEELWLLGHW